MLNVITHSLSHHVFIVLLISFETFALLEEVATAKNKIRIPKSATVEIKSTFSTECFDDDGYDCYYDCQCFHEFHFQPLTRHCYCFSRRQTGDGLGNSAADFCVVENSDRVC